MELTNRGAIHDGVAALMHHLAKQMPFGIRLKVHPGATGNGFAACTSSAAYEAAREAWSAARGAETVTIGAGAALHVIWQFSRTSSPR